MPTRVQSMRLHAYTLSRLIRWMDATVPVERIMRMTTGDSHPGIWTWKYSRLILWNGKGQGLGSGLGVELPVQGCVCWEARVACAGKRGLGVVGSEG